MRKFTDFVVHHRVTMGVLLFSVFFFGILSVQNIGVKLMPTITPPTVAVVTVYPGADPLSVEEQVSVPLERLLAGTSHLQHIETTSVENLSILFLELDWGADPEPVIEGLRTTLDRARLSLPPETEAPIVVDADVVQDPVIVTGLKGDSDVSLGQLTRWADDVLKPAVERLTGVTEVAVLGGARPAVEIAYRPEQLAALGLGTLEIEQGLALQNATVPAGALVEDGRRFATRVGHEIQSLADLREMVVSVKPPDPEASGLLALLPQVITLSDVAAVERTLRAPDGGVVVDGERGVLLFVYQRPGANTLDVTARVRDEIAALLAAPEAERFDARTIYDGSDFIVRSTGNVASAAIFGAILAVLVLFLFVRRVSLALLIGLSIPFSILLSLILVGASDISLNLLTLGGLAIAVGMLVDNSIVVVENIARLGETLPPERAASEGTAEVGPSVVTSTLTNMMVFLPVVLTHGQTGAVFGEMGWTVLFAMFASLVVSVTAIPAVAARMFARAPIAGGDPRVDAATGAGVGDRGTRRDASLRRTVRGYTAALRRSLKRPVLLLGGCSLLVLTSLSGWAGLPQTLLPQIDDSSLTVKVTLPPGSTLEQTEAAAGTVWETVRTLPEVKSVVTRTGNPASGGADLTSLLQGLPSNQAELLVLLHPRIERDRRHSAVADDIRKMVQEDRFAEFDVRVDEGEGLGVLATLIQNTAELEVRAPTRAEAVAVAEQLGARLRAAEETFTHVHVTSDDRQPQLFFQVNPSKALTTGVTAGQIGLTVRQALAGEAVTTLRLDGERVPVLMHPDWANADRPVGRGSLQQLPISSQAEGAKLGTVSTVSEGSSPISLTRVDRRAAVRVNARAADGVSMETATAVAMGQLESVALPPGTTVHGVGFDQVAAEGLSELGIALAIAVLLVYLVMATHFESYLKPLPILLTLPMGSVGAYALIALAGEPMSMSVLLGLIVLVGIAVNNGILLVNTATRFEAEGHPSDEAIVLSGGRRLRPVLMTTLTTALGLLPLCFGVGEGSEIQRPLALTLTGGLVVQTAATLFVLPLLYERTERWRLAWSGWRPRARAPLPGGTRAPRPDWPFGDAEPEVAAADDPDGAPARGGTRADDVAAAREARRAGEATPDAPAEGKTPDDDRR